MPMPHRLDSDAREFFTLVAEIIFSNPFSPHRAALEGLLARWARAPVPTGEGHLFTAVIPALEHQLGVLAARGIDSLSGMSAEDRPLLQYAFLFRLFHRHVADLDGLIQAQVHAGETPVAAPFAAPLLVKLGTLGFSREEALRYLALFYQLRRAYYFIDQALIGSSPAMRRLRHALWNNVFTADTRIYGELLWDRMEDFSTLLLGETGTGKGSAAAAIGRSGLIPFDPRSGRFSASFTATFVATNLSQFPESLIESELFGHRKGAFTGAIEDHQGLFERCNAHGALFLDEIGDLGIPVQIKLLNVLQERAFTPVGSHKPLRFAGRVIAATHRPLQELRASGRFREDFYFRLCSDVIQVPPLRERLREDPEELRQLVSKLVERISGQAGSPLGEAVHERLRRDLPPDYPWPGNVRELEQAVRRVILNREYRPEPIPHSPGQDWLALAAAGRLNVQQLLSQYCRRLYQQLGSYEAVARQLGLDRRTVRKYIEAAEEPSLPT